MQDGLQFRRRIAHRLEPLPPLQKRIHHLPHDGPGADDGHLNHNVVKAAGPQPRQARHLRSALDLEHAHGVGFLQRRINCRIIRRQMRQIHFFPIMLRDELQAIFQRRHHAQPQQIHLDDAQVGAIFFIPLHHHSPGHGGRLQRHHRIKLPLADDHAAGVLSQMPRQVLQAHAQLQIFTHARMPQIKTGIAELLFQGIVRPLPLPRAHQSRKLIDGFGIEAQRLAHLARRRAPAISDDVGGHGRTQLAVALIDVLDHPLALIAAGQVEINIRPLAALFREKALEQQLHGDGIHSGDPQRVAHRAVGGRAAALHQDPLLAAVADDLPDDEEISRKVELFNQRQLALNLPGGALAQRPIALTCALQRARAQKRIHALALRHRIAGKFISQISEREFQAS